MKSLFLLTAFVLSGCSLVVPGGAGLSNIRKPDFVVSFEPGSSAFNNINYLQQQLPKSGVVLVFNTNQDSLTLAEDRLRTLSLYLSNKQLYASYLFSDRLGDQNLVEFHGFDDVSQVPTIVKAANAISLGLEAGFLYPEGHVRTFNSETKRRLLSFEGRFDVTASQQLTDLILDLGWSVGSLPALSNQEGQELASLSLSMDVVLVDPAFATHTELVSIVREWLKLYGFEPNDYGIVFDRVSRKVVVFNE